MYCIASLNSFVSWDYVTCVVNGRRKKECGGRESGKGEGGGMGGGGRRGGINDGCSKRDSEKVSMNQEERRSI